MKAWLAMYYKVELHPLFLVNILFISSDKYPPFRVDVTELFAKEINEKGHKIDWLLHSEEECDQEYVTNWRGNRVYVGRTDTGESLLARINKHYLSVKNDLKIKPLDRSNNYDILLVKDKFIAACFAGFTAWRHKRKFVFWLSYPFAEASIYEAKTKTARYPFLYLIRGYCFDIILYQIVSRTADFIFVQSEQMKRDLAARGVPENKMLAVPMGFAEDKFASLTNSNGQSQPLETIDLLYLGTMIGARKMDFLVRVLAKVKETIPDAQLMFVGDGETEEDRAQILNESKRLGVESSVSITGFLPQDEALRLVQSAKVCLSPFYPTPILNSTSPTKLIEYMALGKAVVANDHPEQSLVLQQSGAGLCVSYDEAQFAAAAAKLLLDPKLRSTMGVKGQRYVSEHRTYETIANNVEHALDKVLEK